MNFLIITLLLVKVVQCQNPLLRYKYDVRYPDRRQGKRQNSEAIEFQSLDPKEQNQSMHNSEEKLHDQIKELLLQHKYNEEYPDRIQDTIEYQSQDLKKQEQWMRNSEEKLHNQVEEQLSGYKYNVEYSDRRQNTPPNSKSIEFQSLDRKDQSTHNSEEKVHKHDKEPCLMVVVSNAENPSVQTLLRKYRYDAKGTLIPNSVKYFIKILHGSSETIIPIHDKTYTPLGGYVRFYREVPPIPQIW